MGEVIRLRARNYLPPIPAEVRRKLEYIYLKAFDFFYAINYQPSGKCDVPEFILNGGNSSTAREMALAYTNEIYKRGKTDFYYKKHKAREKRCLKRK